MNAEKFSAAWVVARRDFVAVIFSKTFVFFLLGPLFPILVGAMAGGIGAKVASDMDRPQLGIAMGVVDADAMIAARAALDGHMAGPMPEFSVIKLVAPGEVFDGRAAMGEGGQRMAAVLSGTIDAPVLTGTPERVNAWRGVVSAIAARARSGEPGVYPEVRVEQVASSAVKVRNGQVVTAQAGQTLLFLLTMILAGMVLSNLVEEKANKIIEVLAAAIPMDALFFGKLFAMLGVSLIGLAVWGSIGGAIVFFGGKALPVLATPAVGWPVFYLLGFLYFAMAYLLLGSLFLSIGGMATTVREVQTLSMPVTMLQLMMFFFASYALSQRGSLIEWSAVIFPFSSPFAMLARAAQDAALWPHLVALVWEAAWVVLIVRMGAQLFRRSVMKSGVASGRATRKPFIARLRRRVA